MNTPKQEKPNTEPLELTLEIPSDEDLGPKLRAVTPSEDLADKQRGFVIDLLGDTVDPGKE